MRNDGVFTKESEMTPVVTAWMLSAGLTVKSEFQVPWGICDLVGACLNRDRVAHRLQLKQNHAIGSIVGAMLLLDIPEVEKRKTTTVEKIVERYAPALPNEAIEREIERLIAMRFVVRTPRGRLQKINGWMPLEERLVAVELKLSRGQEVFRQAHRHLEFASESYMAMPLDVATALVSDAKRFAAMAQTGIGVLGVTKSECHVVHKADIGRAHADPAIRLYCVEKFWRSRSKARSS